MLHQIGVSFDLKLSRVFNDNLLGSRLRVGPKKNNGGIVYKQILINAKLQGGKRVKKREMTGRSPSSWRRSALNCSAFKEEEEGGGGGGEGGRRRWEGIRRRGGEGG